MSIKLIVEIEVNDCAPDSCVHKEEVWVRTFGLSDVQYSVTRVAEAEFKVLSINGREFNFPVIVPNHVIYDVLSDKDVAKKCAVKNLLRDVSERLDLDALARYEVRFPGELHEKSGAVIDEIKEALGVIPALCLRCGRKLHSYERGCFHCFNCEVGCEIE